ncbi:metallophosphoesterase [uncultured Erythrobacter sp.]|uniref:metallophosphoesterase n=1 Tax=uncultured Erythrobacter sp. TaxID=263913 RepID=UPI0026270517|nr:metallophosphoesterase [uncultured Erythrobacter sp.]
MSFRKSLGVALATFSAAILASCSGGNDEMAVEGLLDETEVEAASAPTLTGKFLHLSDIHFDPTADGFGPKLAKAKSVDEWKTILKPAEAFPMSNNNSGRRDSNYGLMISALDEAKKQGPYDFIVYTGDYLPHYFIQGKPSDISDTDFKAGSIALVNGLIKDRFGDTPLIAALGNNDAAPGDYLLQQNSDFLDQVGQSIPVVKGDAAATKSFKAGGNYLVSPPNLPVDFLVLSVFWSHEYPGQTRHCGRHPATAGNAQMKFLTDTLGNRTDTDRPLMLVTHIPPGMDGFSSRKNSEARHQWCEDHDYLSDFLSAVSGSKDDFAMAFAGHTHMDSFRVLSDQSSPYLAMRIGPAVTTWNGNAPSFTVMDYNTTDGAVSDYNVYTLTNVDDNVPAAKATWSKEYSFASAYGSGGYTAKKLASVADSIETGTGSDYTAFTTYYKAEPGMPRQWRYFACATNELSDSAYNSCATGR